MVRQAWLLVVTLAACRSAEAPPAPDPAGWIRWVAASGHSGAPGYSVAAPPDVRPVPVQGIDSAVAHFEGAGMTLSLDYGWYGGMPSCARGCTATDTEIDGYPARILHLAGDGTRPHRVSAEIGGMGGRSEPGSMETSLVAHATCMDAAACRRAERIVRSADFSDTPAGRPLPLPPGPGEP